MSKPKLVFVIGAGASKQFGFPTGAELMADVRTLLSWQERGFSTRAFELLGEYPALVAASDRIRSTLKHFDSIDECLHFHGSDRLIVNMGKTAVACSINRFECSSQLRQLSSSTPLRDANLDAMAATWPMRIFTALIRNRQKEELRHLFDGIAFVTFNYDRSLETILFHALQKVGELRADEAAEIMGTLSIAHPYGTIGRLEWQPGPQPAVSFGSQLKPRLCAEVVDSIFTFTDQINDREELALWRGWLVDARAVVFLGFGFHEQNMQLLKAERRDRHGQNAKVFATTLGTSVADKDEFGTLIRRTLPWNGAYSEQVHLQDVTCDQLLAEFGRAISSASR